MKLILKALVAPIALTISLLVWLCAGLISCTAFVFKLVSAILSVLAILVMLTVSLKNGIILLVIAFLVSPVGIPLLAVKMLGALQHIFVFFKDFTKRCKYHL